MCFFRGEKKKEKKGNEKIHSDIDIIPYNQTYIWIYIQFFIFKEMRQVVVIEGNYITGFMLLYYFRVGKYFAFPAISYVAYLLIAAGTKDKNLKSNVPPLLLPCSFQFYICFIALYPLS